MTLVSIPVSTGELYDKISILEIKKQKLEGKSLLNVEKELELLFGILQNLDIRIDNELFDQLRLANSILWDIEDRIREREHNNDLGDEFIELARSVYKQNDLRASIKRTINQLTSSDIVEEKIYKTYRDYPWASASPRSRSVQGVQQQTALAIRSVIAIIEKRRLKRKQKPPR